MISSSTCLVCGTRQLQRSAGTIAPFIAHRCRIDPATRVRRVWCPHCDLLYYDLRLDLGEVRRLYRGYRGESYVRERVRFEPGYGELHGQLVDIGHPVQQNRIQSLRQAWAGPRGGSWTSAAATAGWPGRCSRRPAAWCSTWTAGPRRRPGAGSTWCCAPMSWNTSPFRCPSCAGCGPSCGPGDCATWKCPARAGGRREPACSTTWGPACTSTCRSSPAGPCCACCSVAAWSRCGRSPPGKRPRCSPGARPPPAGPFGEI